MDNDGVFFRDLLESLSDGVYFLDKERHITYWNKGAETLTGYKREDLLGACCANNLLNHVDASGNRLCTAGCPVAETLVDGRSRDHELFLQHKDGHRVPVRIRVSPLRSPQGDVVGAVEVFSDNSANMRMAKELAELQRLALIDPLTGLANRHHVESHLRSRFEEMRRNGWLFGALFIDIDEFKQVNDRYGHEIGDRVLMMVGKTLDSCSRYFDVVGRWGGEEFVAVIANAQREMLPEIAERFRALVECSSLPVPAGVQVTVSIGGAHAEPGDTVHSLIKRADEKLYRAKVAGRNRVCV
jgi:diguanylate cyclase (GGDEF)-like protein/PAS domain S-box-containing protein